MSLILPNQIRNHFDVILEITSQVRINFHYYVEISSSLQNVTQEIYKICPVFWSNIVNLYEDAYIACLMRLYDVTRTNEGGLINFLNEIKDQSLINEIDSFLNKINSDSFIALRYNLGEVRNKRFFHIDKENARGEYESKKAERILMLNITETPDLNDPQHKETIYLIPDQNGNLSAFWFYKGVNRFLSFPLSLEDSSQLYSLQTDLKNGINAGDHRFFNIKSMCGNNGPDKNELKLLLEETVAIVEKLCGYFGRDSKNYLTEPKDYLHLFDELQILFSEEKLENRLNYVKNFKKYKV